MKEKIEQLRLQFSEELKALTSTKDAELLKVKFLGKKGPVQALMPFLKEVPPADKPAFGQLINDLKTEMTTLCEEALENFSKAELSLKMELEKLDVTLPGRKRFIGKKHPIYDLRDRIIAILSTLGFTVQCGPDIDSDYYNYEGLNFPKDHPARDMQDTLYITKEFLLRSHTSNTQLRVMESGSPPIRVLAPGTVYRNETISARSHVFFHQIEGLYIAEDVTLAHLLSDLEMFLSRLFEKAVEIRARPSFFPFVEPGLEVDVECTCCSGSGCSLCKHTGWLEVLGAGMVHPEVLKNGGIDPSKFSGYAFGMGIERLAMLIYGVKDIRDFTENDMRFLSQF